jgi:hypothetical protein
MFSELYRSQITSSKNFNHRSEIERYSIISSSVDQQLQDSPLQLRNQRSSNDAIIDRPSI